MAAPAAPTLLAPSNGAGVLVPFTISWSAVTDPNGIAAYNWQVSNSSTFSPLIAQGSTNGQTQATVSGLPNATYFWRVQGVDGTFTQGAWSASRTFTVTGAGPGSPASPALAPPQGYSTFHPSEIMTFNWSAVPGAATYILQASTDPSFPIATRIEFNNIPDTTMTFGTTDKGEGNYWARVYAVDANGVMSVPSNVITFSVFFSNPVGPAPAIASPANGTTLSLPVTLTWNHVPNPQPSGYELQIATDSRFSNIESDEPQLNGPSRQEISLTAGTKFWRVRSIQGDSAPAQPALTSWSQTGTFTIPAGLPTPVSVTLARTTLNPGDSTIVELQLTSAVGASGATMSLSSSNPSALPVPATITMPANTAWTQFDLSQFGMKAGSVTQPTTGTITASLNGASASTSFTVAPPSLQTLSISPASMTGGGQANGTITLNGAAPSGGAFVTLTSDSAAATPPSSVTLAPGVQSLSFPITTSAVGASTTATITASWNNSMASAQLTLTPQQPPASLTLTPSTMNGSGTASGSVTLASPASSGVTLQLASSDPAAKVPATVAIPAGATGATFAISVASVTTQTLANISVSGAGVTQSATLTINPPAAALSTLTMTPSTLTGGNLATGTVTLNAAAPAGGAVISLSSSNAAASVPATVTIAAGATSASFTVTTTSVGTSTAATITASYGGLSRSATMTVNPVVQTAALTVTATGRSGERITSTPAGITVAVGTTGSASFNTGTSVTLTVSNGRDAIWSGACSSNGAKAKTCTMMLNAAASVTANVQ